MIRSLLLLFVLMWTPLCGLARGEVTNPIQDDVIYFVLPDRFFNADTTNDTGGYEGDKYSHGFDPTNKAFYHGGDLKGVMAKLDYLQEMGVTAIWMGPIFKNKPVQGASAGYHGYWIIDFTKVDPHFGTNEDLKALVEEAHRRGIKVFFDIIANHTADVIQYREADESGGIYRAKAEYPYTTVGGVDGPPINAGFQGDSLQTEQNFGKLTDPRWAYTPYVPEDEKNIKVPAWLNDPIYYHNRGNSTFSGENSQYGDFFGLDDLFTENPKVVEGMIEIFKYWIREFKMDGFRVDTVKHVNIEFWQQFAPALIAYAREQGIPEFFVFGEVYDATPELLSIYTTDGRLPAVLDFGLQAAVSGFVSEATPTDNLKGFFEKDDYYTDADSDVYQLPTFIGNHDMGRIGFFIQKGADDSSNEDELLQRSRLAHALMYFSRGIPVIYYGDEQGFTGDGLDQDAREDMFPSQVASYNDNSLLGTDATTAADNFNTDHPLYKALKQFGEIRRSHPPLRSGIQVHRYSSDSPGIYAFSRIDPKSRQEYVLAFNNDTKAHSATFKTYASGSFTPVYPAGGKPLVADGALTLEVPPLDFVILKADQPIPAANAAPAVRFTSPADNGLLTKDQFVSVDLGEDLLAEVHFEAKVGDGEFEPLGRDTNPPYRVFFKIGDRADGTPVTFRATASNFAGQTKTAEVKARIDTRLPRVTVNYQNGNGRDSVYSIASTGEILFPQPLSGGRFEFDWPKDGDGVTLIFESREGADFRFDEPIYLSLAEVVSKSRDQNGKLVASLEISTRPALPDPAGAEPPLPETVYIRGGMNSWRETHPLDYTGNNTYHARAELPADWTEFKFADATWRKLNVGAPFGPEGATRSSNPGNLRLRVPEGQGGLFDVWFFAMPKNDDHYFFYRFEPVKPPLAKKIFLRGSLVGNWDAKEDKALVYQGDNIYSLEVRLTGGKGLEFKIGDADWSAGTNFGVAEGSSAALGQPVPLVDNGNNLKLDLEAGVYLLKLDVSNKDAPTLTIVKTTDADIGPYGKPLYLKGTMNQWSNRDDHKFEYKGDNRFVLATTLDAGAYEFKVADADWSAGSDFGGGLVATDKSVALVPKGGNMTLNVPEKGLYRFEVNASNIANPTLAVSTLGPFDVEIFLRGSMNDWGTTKSLRYAGENRYLVETELTAGDYEFKVGDTTWNIVNIGAAEGDQGSVSLGQVKNLAHGKNPANLRVTVPADGRYKFTLEVKDPNAPILTISAE